MSARTIGKPAGGGGASLQMVTGEYTGDGNATQAVAGVGFQPIYMLIYDQLDVTDTFLARKTDQDGVFTKVFDVSTTSIVYEADHIISLDVDGFTVGDGTGGVGNHFNINLHTYTYVCFGTA